MTFCKRSIPASPGRQFFRDEQHDHRRAAADHDGVDKYAKRLHETDLYRIALLRRSRRAWCGTGTSLIGKQATLHAVHEHRAKAARRDLAKSEGFRKDLANTPGTLLKWVAMINRVITK